MKTIIILAILASGIYSQAATSAEITQESTENKPTDNTAIDYEDQQLSNALKRCRSAVEKYEKRAQAGARFSFWTAFLGASTGLLGSALSGHASTATVALLSGTSGITNGMQQQLSSVGYDQEGQQRTRNAIIDTVSPLVTAYSKKENSEEKKKELLIQIYFACDLFKTSEKGTAGQEGD